jgi:tRNA/rRNA methyltransferase
MLQFSFILVEPEDERNVGAAARAMNTMGHQDLRLVFPKCDYLSERSRVLAHGSQHILEAATVYPSLAEALTGIDLSCATTARHRLEKYHYVSVRDLPEVLASKGEGVSQIGLVFGGERSGLSGEDVALCDVVTNIPQACLYPSLNLSQAVMILSFLFSEQLTQVQIKDQRLNRESMPVQEYANLKQSTLVLMARIGLAAKYQTFVIKGLARLGQEDLYLIHRIRAYIDRALDRLEQKQGCNE